MAIKAMNWYMRKTRVDKKHFVRWMTLGPIKLFIHYWKDKVQIDLAFWKFRTIRTYKIYGNP